MIKLFAPPKARNFPAAMGANWPALNAALRKLRARAVASGASPSVSQARPAATNTASTPTGT